MTSSQPTLPAFFNPAFFAANRQALRERLQPQGPVIIAANGLLQRSGDTSFDFSQDRNFWYLTGLDMADVLLVLDSSGDYLILPHQTDIQAYFDGAHDTILVRQTSDIRDIYDQKTGWQKLKRQLSSTTHIYTLGHLPLYYSHFGFYPNPARRQVHTKLRRHAASDTQFHDIRPQLAWLRCRKQPPELAALQCAIDTTSQTLAEVRPAAILAELRSEYGLEAAITYGFRRRGAGGHGFSPIVASGRHATTIHHLQNDGLLEQSALTVIDIGAEVQNYTADITRTVSAGPLTPRQQAVYKEVHDVLQQATALLKPGTLLRPYEAEVERLVGQALQRLGLVGKNPSSNDIRRYYPHAASHFLGLDAHDSGDYSAPLEQSMVVTCEPGIYIPEEGLGVRIEDDVLITTTGHQVLSSACGYEPFVD